jgi:hypothetical protein
MTHKRTFAALLVILALCAVTVIGLASRAGAAQIRAGSVSGQHITAGSGQLSSPEPDGTNWDN